MDRVAAAPRNQALPFFEVQLAAPDLARWVSGNTGVPGFWRFSAALPGPHVVITALMHGNEIAGAVVLDRLLRQKLRPLRGTLTLGFANLAAFFQFDPAQPTASRFVDEDMNRLWDEGVLASHRHSVELDRARAILPMVEKADFLLDLHSMLWPSEPLILCGPTERGRALARSLGTPPRVVADCGHVSGKRLIDYTPFADPNGTRTAVLVEAGQHWLTGTVGTCLASVSKMLSVTRLIPAAAPSVASVPSRCAEVTHVITAATGGFSFVRPFEGGEVVPGGGTLLALDGDTEIRTPYDDCLLVMPSLRPGRGHTAVRLAKFVD